MGEQNSQSFMFGNRQEYGAFLEIWKHPEENTSSCHPVSEEEHLRPGDARRSRERAVGGRVRTVQRAAQASCAASRKARRLQEEGGVQLQEACLCEPWFRGA